MIQDLLHRISRILLKLRFQPIRVFCLHEISAKPEFANEQAYDWMEINAFKQTIMRMREQEYVFISLNQAYDKIKHDIFRFKKYAVLTDDDARQSLNEILPWLIENKLPMMLFVNANYLDGKEHRVEGINPFHCLTMDELQNYVEKSNGLISIQSHGWEHLDATRMTAEEFRAQIRLLPIMGGGDGTSVAHHGETHGRGFHAYTWGRHTLQTDAILKESNIIPVLMDGMKNYNDASCIHRELLENYDK